MKLHDLKPAPGSRQARRRVGRGIAAGQGKTAGRGTKGQKARTGGKIPAWFEGGQTPLHQRLPKLHGFKNPFRIEYEVVNIGSIAALVEAGVLESGEMPGAKKGKAASSAPITVNQEILRAAGLVRTLSKPLKVLGGGGDLSTALFVVADAFSASARSKIEAAGGSVNVIEVPGAKRPAVKAPASEPAAAAEAPEPEVPAAVAEAAPAEAEAAPASEAAEPAAEDAPAAKPAKAPRAPRATKATKAAATEATEGPEAEATADTAEAPAPKPRARRKPADTAGEG